MTTSAFPQPKKSLGQHFLFDPGILGRIVEAAGVRAGDAVLEIGPGPGGLTRALIESGARVWAVEADARMVEHLSGLALPGLTLQRGNALKTDYPALAKEAGGPLLLVANLPYNISGPLLARLLRQREAFRSMTLMFQREVAERVAAPPGGRVRGTLSVMSQAFCEVRLLFRVPPGAFRPPPKVESAVIRLDILPSPVRPLADETLLWRLVGEAFRQRRKMLRNGLKRWTEEMATGAEIYAEAGLTGEERPETVDSARWIELANAFARRGEPGG